MGQRWFCAALSICAVLSCGCNSPWRNLRPVVSMGDSDESGAMQAAGTIVAATIEHTDVGGLRWAPKPPNTAGPQVRVIPLYLARIRAKVLFTVRGQAGSSVEFFSWVWASGSHGGPRLFHATEGSSHVLFLRRDGRYWRTVGDYPSYDLEIHSMWTSRLTAMWQAGELRELPPVERISALLLRAEVESATAGDVRNSLAPYPAGVDGVFYVRGLFDLTRLMGPYRVATWVDALCREAKSAATRFAACSVAASNFPGRCDAVRQAQDAAKGILGTPWRANGWQSCLTASSCRRGSFGWCY
ncbi:MAG TPA: hypothetical protein VN736_02285 [Candidatus Limnocylindrales bacterium]|nr:hypothetical protein [Candidatus Limnocylindrales bacterium]